MHSSRMRTARTLTVHGGCLPRGCLLGGGGGCLPEGCLPRGVSAWGVFAQGGICLGVGCLPGGVPCDLSHDAFDVTCMLPPHQLRPNTSAAAYIVLAHCMMGYTPPPVDRMTHTCKNITFPQTLFAGGNDTIFVFILISSLPYLPHESLGFWKNKFIYQSKILFLKCATYTSKKR